MKKLFLLCSFCFLLSSCYTYNQVRKMEKEITVKALEKTTSMYFYGIIFGQNTPTDIKLQEDNAYLFQKMLNNCWIEGTLVNNIDWKSAFNNSRELQ